MRCRSARRRISDALDGAVGARGRARLEAHLAVCPACRVYRGRLSLIQAGSRLPLDRPAESWADFERALAAKLDAAGERGPSFAPEAARRRAWAWVAAAASVLLAVVAWYLLQRPAGAPFEAWTGYEGVIDPLVLAAESDTELAGRVDKRVGALLDDLAPAPDPEAVVLPADDPLFWEGLSDDDLRAIVGELEKPNGRGGPA